MISVSNDCPIENNETQTFLPQCYKLYIKIRIEQFTYWPDQTKILNRNHSVMIFSFNYVIFISTMATNQFQASCISSSVYRDTK